MYENYHPLQCSEILTVGAAVLLENVNAALIPKLSTIGGVVLIKKKRFFCWLA
jgi:hypothetical protein